MKVVSDGERMGCLLLPIKALTGAISLTNWWPGSHVLNDRLGILTWCISNWRASAAFGVNVAALPLTAAMVGKTRWGSC